MNWTDELWPLVIQLYQKKPVGVKPMYSRETVALALELHIPPQVLYQRMFQLRQQLSPSLQQLMDTIGSKPKKLEKVCNTLRRMRGMGNASEFYDDVAIQETFELDFRPANAKTAMSMGRPLLTPVMLIMILDLYFRLIPATMVADTPDVVEVAKLINIKPKDVVDILEVYQYCDPFVRHDDTLFDPILPVCNRIWQRFANDDPMQLSNMAHQLKAYFK